MSVVDYYPFSGSRGRLRLGLSSIGLSDWIRYEDDFPDRIREKKKLISRYGKRVLDVRDDSIPSQNELLDSVLEFLQQHRTGWFEFSHNEVFSIRENTAYKISDYTSCPLELISYLVADDYCLLGEYGNGFRLVAACVCSPTWWELSQKMGKPLTAIHAPIANLEEKVGRMIRHFLKNLSAGECYLRSNWFLASVPDYCVFPDRSRMCEALAAVTQENIEHQLYLRCERQTFRKLEKTGHIAFGIKVYTDPVGIVRRCPAIAEDLVLALDTMKTAQKQALAIDIVEKPLRKYLDTVLM